MPAHPPPQEIFTAKNLSPPAISRTSCAGSNQETSPFRQDIFILPPTCNLPEGAIISPQEFLLLSALTSDQGEIPRIPSQPTDPQPPTFSCNTPYLIQEANRLFTSFRAGNLPFATFQTELEETFVEISLFNLITFGYLNIPNYHSPQINWTLATQFFEDFNTRVKYQNYTTLTYYQSQYFLSTTPQIPNQTKMPTRQQNALAASAKVKKTQENQALEMERLKLAEEQRLKREKEKKTRDEARKQEEEARKQADDIANQDFTPSPQHPSPKWKSRG
jgi:hypothetical protein